MIAGVVSDSHGDLHSLKKAVNSMQNVDVLIHLGDYSRDAYILSKEINREIIYVKGNCDFQADADCDKTIILEGKKIFITHGHNYNVKYDYLDLYFKAQEIEADLVLFGHTHQSEIFEKDGILFVNPGSISRPRGQNQSYAMIYIEKGVVLPRLVNI